MTRPLVRPPRKNPILRTRLPTLPPGARSRVALGLTAAAARGRFELQVCRDCGTVQYPPREACRACLSPRLDWRAQDGTGELVSETTLRHSHELFFRERMPWRLGLVKLDNGPIVVAHLHGDCAAPPSRVRVRAHLDRAGQAALLALPDKDTPHMADDRELRELTCDPKFRKVLVTDAKTPLGQALVEALVTAGTDLVWAGEAEPWKKPPGYDRLKALPQVATVPLDVTNSRAVKELAGEIGGRVDIVINTADHHRNFGRAAPTANRARWPGSMCCRCSRCRISRRTAPTRPRRPPLCRWRNACAPSSRRPACASSTCFPDRSTMNGIRRCRRRRSRRRASPPISSRRCAAAPRTFIRATWRRIGSSAGATIQRRWSASL